jgi:hypothetical protein
MIQQSFYIYTEPLKIPLKIKEIRSLSLCTKGKEDNIKLAIYYITAVYSVLSMGGACGSF